MLFPIGVLHVKSSVNLIRNCHYLPDAVLSSLAFLAALSRFHPAYRHKTIDGLIVTRNILSSIFTLIWIIGYSVALVLFSRVQEQAQSDGYYAYVGNATTVQLIQVFLISSVQLPMVCCGIAACVPRVPRRRPRNQVLRTQNREIVQLDRVV